MDKEKIDILANENWPEGLSEVPQPPKQIYIKGELPPTDFHRLCVVGSRKFTSYGKAVCEILIESLRGQKVVIISGLALGIDSIAHKKALEVGLPNIAVPGSGLSEKVLYPSLHRNLARQIVEKGGCLLSEFEPNFKATPYSFPQRNRIMAGISESILIIEAEKKSGTLITARLALDYNREVLSVPGSILNSSSEGTNFLIKLGARPICNCEDLFDALNLKEISTEDKFADCSSDEKKIIELLREPMPRDELIRESGLAVGEIQVLLSVMEIKGIIKETMGEIRLS